LTPLSIDIGNIGNPRPDDQKNMIRVLRAKGDEWVRAWAGSLDAAFRGRVRDVSVSLFRAIVASTP
jgi:hypothetical protein